MSVGGFELERRPSTGTGCSPPSCCSACGPALNLIDSPFGRALRALHGSEVASQGVGVDVARYKMAIFVLSAFFASIMGSLTAHYVGFVSPDIADFFALDRTGDHGGGRWHGLGAPARWSARCC